MFSKSFSRVACMGFLLIVGAVSAPAQVRGDLAVLAEDRRRPTSSAVPGRRQPRSEMQTAAVGLLRLYQKVLSSQDRPTCTFTVSCSRFAVAAIEKHGLLHGTAMAADRVLRCNGFGARHYEYHADLLLAIDVPLDRYRLGRRTPPGQTR